MRIEARIRTDEAITGCESFHRRLPLQPCPDRNVERHSTAVLTAARLGPFSSTLAILPEKTLRTRDRAIGFSFAFGTGGRVLRRSRDDRARPRCVRGTSPDPATRWLRSCGLTA